MTDPFRRFRSMADQIDKINSKIDLPKIDNDTPSPDVPKKGSPELKAIYELIESRLSKYDKEARYAKWWAIITGAISGLISSAGWDFFSHFISK